MPILTKAEKQGVVRGVINGVILIAAALLCVHVLCFAVDKATDYVYKNYHIKQNFTKGARK